MVVKTFEEAQKIRAHYPFRISRGRMLSDSLQSAALWIGLYFGIRPGAMIKNRIYQRRLKRAVDENAAKDHEAAPAQAGA